MEGIPTLRSSLDVFEFPVNGRSVPCLCDSLNVTNAVLPLTPFVYFVLQLIDGRRTFKDIQVEFVSRTGSILQTEVLEHLLATLDEALMLDNERFRQELARIETDYHAMPQRPHRHSGAAGGYVDDPHELAQTLEGYFTHPDGPGESLRRLPADRRLHAVVAPHIDFARGGPSYAHAYAEIARDPADLYVVLGTSHPILSQQFSVTRKDFGTPFGPMKTDTDFIDLLEETSGMKLETDALVHRNEHSIELQAVWMRHLLPERTRFVPILCGSFGAALRKGGSPMEEPQVRRFVEGLREAIARCGKRVVLVAAADIAHIGTGFGDEAGPDEKTLDDVEAADLEMMEAAVRRDREEFFASVQRDGDRRRVCGLSPIYAMLAAMKPSEGRLLNYKQCVDPNGFRTVTIASAAWFE